MKIPPIYTLLLQVVFALVSNNSLAQTLPVVTINGTERFVYPAEVPAEPSDDFLNVFGMTIDEFSLYRTWIKNNDARLQIPKEWLIDSLDATLIRERTISVDNLGDNKLALNSLQRHEHYFLIPLRSKYGLRKKLHKKRHSWDSRYFERDASLNQKKLAKTLRANPRCQTLYFPLENAVLPPQINSLPDGNYVLYYDNFFTVAHWKDAELQERKPAMLFSLKSNLLDGPVTFFTATADTMYSGSYTMGLQSGKWEVKEIIERITYRENWLRIKSYLMEDSKTSKLTVSFSDGLPDGDFFRNSYNKLPNLNISASGHYSNGIPDSIWSKKDYFSTSLFDYSPLKANEFSGYGNDWIYLDVPFSDEDFTFDMLWETDGVERIFHQKRLIVTANKGVEILKFLLRETGLDYGVANEQNEQRIYFLNPFHTFIEKRSVSDQKLHYRYMADHEHKLVVGSRYFLNGALFDTCGIDEKGRLMHRVYDMNGKLYVETEYSLTDGEVLHQNYSIPPKVVVLDNLSGVEQNESGTYYWDGDTLIGNQRFLYKMWSEDKIPNRESYYDLKEQCFVEREFNTNGEPLYTKKTLLPYTVVDSIDSVQTWALSSYNLSHLSYLYPTLTSVHDGEITFEIYARSTSEQYLSHDGARNNVGRVLINGIPFNGELVLRNSKRTVRPKIRSNRLNVPIRELSKSYERFDAITYEMGAKTDLNESYAIRKILDVFFELSYSSQKVSYFDGNEYAFGCDEAKGMVKNGYLSGDWKFTLNGITIAAMCYSDSISFGKQSFLGYVSATTDEDLKRYKKDPNMASYLPIVDKSKYYILETKLLRNGEWNGAGFAFNCAGDTISRYQYKNGFLHGYNNWKNSSERVSGEYVMEQPHGQIVLLTDTYIYKEGGGKFRRDTLVTATYDHGSKEGQAFRAGGEHLIHTSFKNNFPFGETRLVSRNGTTERIFYTKEQGIIERLEIYKDGILSYAQTPLPEDTFQLNLEYDFSEFSRHNQFDDIDTHLKYIKKNTDQELSEAYFTKYYPDGSVAREGVLDGVRKKGLWKYTSPDGNHRYSIRYEDSVFRIGADSMAIKGVELPSRSNGNKLRYILDERDFYRCVSDEYFAVRQYIDPGKSGAVTYTYDDGTIMSSGTMKEGLPDGVWRFYDRTGGLMYIGAYHNGKRTGRWLEGDLNEKANLDNICLDENNSDLDILVKQLEKDKTINVIIYINGIEHSNQEYKSAN